MELMQLCQLDLECCCLVVWQLVVQAGRLMTGPTGGQILTNSVFSWSQQPQAAADEPPCRQVMHRMTQALIAVLGMQGGLSGQQQRDEQLLRQAVQGEEFRGGLEVSGAGGTQELHKAGAGSHTRVAQHRRQPL
eukprot:gene12712-12842_t